MARSNGSNTHICDEVCKNTVDLRSSSGFIPDIGLGDGDLFCSLAICIEPMRQTYSMIVDYEAVANAHLPSPRV